MRNKLSYLFFLLFLFCSVPYLLTVVLSGKEEAKPVDFQTHTSGYTVTVSGKPMDLEAYLLGVPPTQISMDDEKEALKAQAVILRTDILRRIGDKKNISQDSLPYKYESDDNLQEKLGDRKYKITDQSRKQAVGETTGEVITYEGKIYTAVFPWHQCRYYFECQRMVRKRDSLSSGKRQPERCGITGIYDWDSSDIWAGGDSAEKGE